MQVQILRAETYYFTAAQILRVLGARMWMPFSPRYFIPPHLAGSKIPAWNRSPSYRNGFQTTACTTGVCGTDEFCARNHAWKIIGSEQKQLKTTWNHQKKFHRAVHTQEVTGSSPVVSTKKFLISQEIRNFFALSWKNDSNSFGFWVDPYRDPYGEKVGGHIAAPDRLFPARRCFWLRFRSFLERFCGKFLSAFLWILHSSTDHVSNGFCRLPFHFRRSMGVGTEGKSCWVVTQGAGQCLDIHSVF